jgi:hypothetical protein
VLTLGVVAVAAQAKELRYRYVAIDQVEPPAGFFNLFLSQSISNSGRVYSTSVNSASGLFHVAVYADGAITVLQPGFPFVFVTEANEGGTIGGWVQLESGSMQAALFHGDQVELIPPLQGESRSEVVALNDAGVALVTSYDASEHQTIYLYKHGRTTPLDFELSGAPTLHVLHLNNRGIISGTDFGRGVRFDTRTGQTTQLDPLPTETHAWALDLNKHGEVLGLTFNNLPYIQRIGVWDRYGAFHTYFVEDIVSNDLRFNDHNLIVITQVTAPPSESGNSYLVPEPGVRVNLADLVENLPVGANLSRILDINNHGDMVGRGSHGAFLLERIRGRERKEHGNR